MLASLGAETITAVHRPIATGDERNGGVYATLGAYHRVHLAGSAAVSTTLLVFAGFPALRTALRLVGVSTGIEELLLSNRENERCVALPTHKILVC